MVLLAAYSYRKTLHARICSLRGVNKGDCNGPFPSHSRALLHDLGPRGLSSAPRPRQNCPASKTIPRLLGTFGLVVLSLPLPNPFLVVGIPLADGRHLDFSSLFADRALRRF